MDDDERQVEAWLESERTAIRAELQLKEQDRIETAPERTAKFNAVAKLRREADVLLDELLGGLRSFPSS